MRTSFRRSLGLLTVFCAVTLPLAAFAQSAAAVSVPFTDIPQNSPVAPAAEYLKAKGIIQAVGQFKPDDKLTRAQTVKILVAPLMKAEELAKMTKSSFSDVPATEWYMPSAEAAKTLGIVDAASTFHPNQPVTKAAFIKMLLASKKIDYRSSYSDFQLPLSPDVSNPADWFYPVMRYAVVSSMTAVAKDGLLSPSRELTRGEMALLYYRLDMYAAGRRTQALLSQTETDIANVLQTLDAKQIDQAEVASARAMLSARGALHARPDEPIVKGAVKVSEGFRALVQGYKAGVAGDLDAVIRYAKDAYALADKAKAFSANLGEVSVQMQAIAKNMADQARSTKTAPVTSPIK